MSGPDADLPDVQLHDVWIDNDPRFEPRKIKVMGFDGTDPSMDQKVHVENVNTGQKSKIKRGRFRSSLSTGYTLFFRQKEEPDASR